MLESVNGGGTVGVLGADGQNDLANIYTGNSTLGLTEGTIHTCLQMIGTGA